MEGKKVCHGCSIAHRHKHLTKDRVNPCLEIYHIHLFLGAFKRIKYNICFGWPSSQNGYHEGLLLKVSEPLSKSLHYGSISGR